MSDANLERLQGIARAAALEDPRLAREIEAEEQRESSSPLLAALTAGLVFALSTSHPWEEPERQRFLREQRSRRVDCLSEILESLDRTNDLERWATDQGGSIPSRIHRDLSGRDRSDSIASLRALYESEKFLLEIEEKHRQKPNQRPPTTKNFAAQQIADALYGCGLSCWEACGFIAHIYIDAGIETRDANRVRRSLYDKLKRLT